MNKKKKPKPKSVGSLPDPVAEDSDTTDSRAMRLEITRINRYERNPRRSKNPEYDRIKASILVSGMDQALLITQRPDENDYIVQAGGNTRLQILKELFETTGEERFFWVDCWFVDWDRESTVLLAHLRENELRGNLTFIDKARAVFEVSNLIAEESDSSPISARNLDFHWRSESSNSRDAECRQWGRTAPSRARRRRHRLLADFSDWGRSACGTPAAIARRIHGPEGQYRRALCRLSGKSAPFSQGARHDRLAGRGSGARARLESRSSAAPGLIRSFA